MSSGSPSSRQDGAAEERELCDKFAGASLGREGDREEKDGQGVLVAKGKPRTPAAPTCNPLIKRQLKEMLEQRRPMDLSIDGATLDTPIHKFLEAPDNCRRPGCELVEPLNQLLTELATKGYLPVYINMPNKCGRTPLSLCLKSANLADLIGPLVRRGAQLHHLCGNISERCNHLHYAMLKGPPETIDRALDEVFNSHPFGADGMYALNLHHKTPKAALEQRIIGYRGPIEVQLELGRILDRIQGYPPVDELPELPA